MRAPSWRWRRARLRWIQGGAGAASRAWRAVRCRRRGRGRTGSRGKSSRSRGRGCGRWRAGRRAGTARRWRIPRRRPCCRVPSRGLRRRTTDGRWESRHGQNPHGCTSPVPRWPGPACCGPHHHGCPFGRACCYGRAGRSRYRAGCVGWSAARTPCRGTDRGRRRSASGSCRRGAERSAGTCGAAGGPSPARNRAGRTT